MATNRIDVADLRRMVGGVKLSGFAEKEAGIATLSRKSTTKISKKPGHLG